MIKKCLDCNNPGRGCIPYLMTLPGQELIAWCKMYKKKRGWTNSDIATRSNTPKGTIDRLFSSENADFRFSTIQPIICALAGCTPEDLECGAPEEYGALQKRIQELEAELDLRDESIRHYKKNYEDMTMLVANTNKRHEEQLHFLRGEIKRKNKFVTALAILAVLALLYIIATLIIDIIDPSQGFYWLEGLLHLPQSIIEQTGVNT